MAKAADEKAIVNDKSHSGSEYKKNHISLKKALFDEIEVLKKKRAKWAGLFCVQYELREESTLKTAKGMFANQAYNLFLYIRNCGDKEKRSQDTRYAHLMPEY